MEHIFITGASGFIGNYLAGRFLAKGHPVTGTGTAKDHPLERQFGRFKWISADTTQKGDWQQQAARADIIINLAGRNIFRQWTTGYKQAIHDSRVLTTALLTEALGPRPLPRVLLNASAVGYYGDSGDEPVDERRGQGGGFLAKVCGGWESAAEQAETKGVRTARMRFGVVLGDGGALSLMKPAFKLGLGGPIGHGRQWFPFIHIRDLAWAVELLISDRSLSGPFNFTSPEPVRQKQFSKCLGRVLGRPAFAPAPAPLVRLLAGEMGSALLQGQKALPMNLARAGFSFLYPGAEKALQEILGNKQF